MNFSIVYVRSGLGRVLFTEQSKVVSQEQLRARVLMLIPESMQDRSQLITGDDELSGTVHVWTSLDPESKAMLIAIEV